MKPFKLSLFLFSVILLLTGCNQIENDVPATVVLEASKTSNIKKGEPVMFKFNNIPDESDVLWKVYPDSGVNLTVGGNKASVLFSIAGDYEINATFGSAVVETNVHVVDSVYVPVQHDIVPLKPDETIYVSVSVFDSSAVGKPDILVTLNFTTSNKYDCMNNYLRVNQEYPMEYKISFEGVFIPDSRFCFSGEKEAQQSVILYPDPQMRSNKIEISLLGKTYKGDYWVWEDQFYIYWPYTEGKIIFTNAKDVGENNGEASGFDIDNPDVDLFVSLLKSGTYKFYYDTAEYGEKLLLAMPKFNLNHLEALLEYAKDTTIISNFPTNPFELSISPYPVGRDYFILNECLLWIVEGIRTGEGFEFKFPSLAPYLVNNSKPATEREKGLTITEILEVGELYYSWWHNSAIFEWWLRNPPLEGTSYSWF